MTTQTYQQRGESVYRSARRVARRVVLAWYRTKPAKALYSSKAALVLPRRGFHPARAYRSTSKKNAQQRFGQTHTFTFFIGYWRSGHTALAAAMNGHPNVLIAHELDFFRWLALNVSPGHLLRLIVERDRWFEKRDRSWETYSYRVPGGTYEACATQVVGDKMAAITTQRLLGRPELLTQLRSKFDFRIRVINVVRNPFDNIATAHRKSDMSLDETIDRYRQLSTGVRQVTNQLQTSELITIRHDELTTSAESELKRVWEYLCLPRDDEYLPKAAAFIKPPSRRARDGIAWSDDQIQAVHSIIQEFDHLDGYHFNSE